jgi:hypothetical protein
MLGEINHVLQALRRVSLKYYDVDLARPAWLSAILDVPFEVAYALALEPEKWYLALWRPGEECAAPQWPDQYTAVLLLAVRGCKTVRARGEDHPDGPLYDDAAWRMIKTALNRDAIKVELMPDLSPSYSLIAREELRSAVEEWLGEPLAGLEIISPKLLMERPKLRAAAVLGALRYSGGFYVPERQLLALL